VDTLKNTNKLEWAKLQEQRDWHRLSTGMGLDPATGEVNPMVLAYAHQVQQGMSPRSIPQNLRGAVMVYLDKAPQQTYTSDAIRTFTSSSKNLMQNYVDNPTYKMAMNARPVIDRIEAAYSGPHTAITDADLLDGLTKLNTGGQAITEAQINTVLHGSSLADRVNQWTNQLKGGGVLSDQQRTEIHDLAKQVYGNYQKSYQKLYDEATGRLRGAQIPQAFWTLPDLNAAARGEAATGTAAGMTPEPAPSTGVQYTPEQIAAEKKRRADLAAQGKK